GSGREKQTLIIPRDASWARRLQDWDARAAQGFSWDRSAYILRHIRQQLHLRAAFCAYHVTDFVGSISEGNDNVHGLLSVFAGVNEQSRCRRNVEDGFIGSRCCARSSEAAVLIIFWRRVLRRGSLPKLRVDKDHRTGVCH